MIGSKKQETSSNVPSTDMQQRLNATVPHNMPLYLAAVWQCESTDQADRLLAGELDGMYTSVTVTPMPTCSLKPVNSYIKQSVQPLRHPAWRRFHWQCSLSFNRAITS